MASSHIPWSTFLFDPNGAFLMLGTCENMLLPPCFWEGRHPLLVLCCWKQKLHSGSVSAVQSPKHQDELKEPAMLCVCVCGLSVLWHFNIHNILSPKKRSCHQHIVRKSFPQLFCVFGGFGECLRGFGVVCSWKIYRCQSCDLMRFEGDMKTNIILYRSFLFNIYIYLHIYNILSQRYL